MKDLPSGWAETNLGEICLAVAKHQPTAEPDVNFTYIDISAIDNERHSIAEAKRLLGKDAPSRARQVVREGDTVLSTVRTYLKNSALVPPELEGATASTGFCVLRPSPGIHPRFLFYRVLDDNFVAALSRRQTGTSYPAVRDEDVRAMPLALPPIVEQQRIVKAIDEKWSRIDAGVESLRRARRNVLQLRNSALRPLFQLDRWPFKPLGDVSEVVGGVTKDKKRESALAMVEVPYLRVANVQRGFLDLDEVKTIRVPKERVDSLALRPGDLLLTEGGDRDKLGRGWVWEGQIEHCIHQNHVFRARLFIDEFVPKFVSYYANTFGREWFNRMGKQTTNLASVSLTTLKRFPVPAPPIDEQEAILSEMERQSSLFDAVEQAIESALDRAGTLRQSILLEAFAGRLVHQDATDERASEILKRVRVERAKA